MVFMIVFKKLKSFFLFLITLLRRSLCCFRRRRRPSNDFVPLTQIGVVSNENVAMNETDNWNDWGDQQIKKPVTVKDHIDLYRQQSMCKQEDESEEQQINFFQDMTPKITKQAKLFLNQQREVNNHTARLSLDATDVVMAGNELGDWEDNSGWEGETLDYDAQAALREKRRLERERRLWEQQQRRQEKVGRSTALGAKVSS